MHHGFRLGLTRPDLRDRQSRKATEVLKLQALVSRSDDVRGSG
jgi:hypothetical protein